MDIIYDSKFNISTIKYDSPCIIVKYISKRGIMRFNKFYYLLTILQHDILKKYLSEIPHKIDELFDWLKTQNNLNMNEEGVWEFCSDFSFDGSETKERMFFNIWKKNDNSLGFWIDE